MKYDICEVIITHTNQNNYHQNKWTLLSTDTSYPTITHIKSYII